MIVLPPMSHTPLPLDRVQERKCQLPEGPLLLLLFFPLPVLRRSGTALWKWLLIGAIALAGSAQAAGLGEIKVQSVLGQPFSAEIDVSGLPTDDFEFDAAAARIASAEAYEVAKTAYPPFLGQFRVTLERRANKKPFVRIAGYAPVNEPAFNLLIDFNWRGGRIMQKYSILLDPAPSTSK